MTQWTYTLRVLGIRELTFRKWFCDKGRNTSVVKQANEDDQWSRAKTAVSKSPAEPWWDETNSNGTLL